MDIYLKKGASIIVATMTVFDEDTEEDTERLRKSTVEHYEADGYKEVSAGEMEKAEKALEGKRAKGLKAFDDDQKVRRKAMKKLLESNPELAVAFPGQ